MLSLLLIRALDILRWMRGIYSIIYEYDTQNINAKTQSKFCTYKKLAAGLQSLEAILVASFLGHNQRKYLAKVIVSIHPTHWEQLISTL